MNVGKFYILCKGATLGDMGQDAHTRTFTREGAKEDN